MATIQFDQATTHKEIFNVTVLTDQTEEYDPVTNPYIPLDLTGWTIEADVRIVKDDGTLGAKVINHGTASSPPEVEIDVGEVTWNIAPEDTENLVIRDETQLYEYEVRATSPSDIAIVIAKDDFIVVRAVV